jgi:hypothetical protein
MRWRGGALTELDLDLPRSQPGGIRTDEDTLSLLGRLAALPIISTFPRRSPLSVLAIRSMADP